MTTNTSQSIRPTKKQRELLSYIEQFISEHGYSPSYREIMNGLNYTSVATVSLHVTSLIRRGHLRKRDRSARSLEVVSTVEADTAAPDATGPEEKWLHTKVEAVFKAVEQAGTVTTKDITILQGVLHALGVLDMQTVVQQFAPRLEALSEKVS